MAKTKSNNQTTDVVNDQTTAPAPDVQTENATDVQPVEGTTEGTAEGNLDQKDADEPTSENLVKIRTSLDEAWTRVETAKPRSKDFIDAMAEIQKLQGQEKAELAQIDKNKRDLAIKAEMNARVAMLDELINLHDEVLRINADENASIEDKNTKYDAYKAQHEKIANELLAKYPRSSSSTPATAGVNGVANGEKSKQIKESILGFCREGKTVTEAVKLTVEKGFTRGTTGTVRTQMKQAGELVEFGEKPE